MSDPFEAGAAPPGPPTSSAPPQAASKVRRDVGRPVIAFFRAHPVLSLLVLTPGIPEYLSSSSNLTGLIVAPPVFLLFLGLNLALYGPGVLLIREAVVRWKKGWASVILLGAAYAILEEGVALSTFFNPRSSVVGSLGYYGHWLGVSWVWMAGLLMVHIVFSISLPLLLFGFVFPEWRGRRLLSDRQTGATVVLLGLDVLLLFGIVRFGEHFTLDPGLLLGAFVAIGALATAAYSVPAGLLHPFGGRPTAGPIVFAVLGAFLLLGTYLIEGIGQGERAPPALTIAAVAAFYASSIAVAISFIGERDHERQLLGFATGALASIAVFGFIAALPTPVVVVGDVVLVVFLRRLWGAHPAEGTLRERAPASTSS